MKERILKIIKEIEKEKNVKVILVADTGSRSLGYSTSSSDYDIRFVYVQKPEKYLELAGTQSKEKLTILTLWDLICVKPLR